MSFTHRPSPARVSNAAAAAFPRWALYGLLALYLVTGLAGREPWNVGGDAEGFGLMWTLAHGNSVDWLLPNIDGEWVAQGGPLPFWVGAASIAVFGPLLGDAGAARLTAGLWILLATAALWYATYRLARRAEAQPVVFAFGGEAGPRDYGRMLADIAVLLFIGTIGLVARLRDLTADAAALAFTALALYGLALALDRPRRGALLAGVAIGALALSRGPLPAALLLLAAVVALATHAPRTARLPAILLALVAAVGGFAVWPLAAQLAPAPARAAFFEAWAQAIAAGTGLPGPVDLAWLLRYSAWFLWPLWPLAAWTLYAWRHGLRAAHVAIPALVLLTLLAAFLLSRPSSQSGLTLLAAPLVVLAALGATTLRRATENLIDWFSMVAFTLFALALWAYFLAFQLGVPPAMARSVTRLIPGFAEPWSWAAVGLALLASLAWLLLAGWRLAIRPPMLWRGPLLAASGLLTLWAIAMLLALPGLNYVRSYAPLARALAAQLMAAEGDADCVATRRVPAAQRVLFAYHGHLRLAAPDAAGSCRWLLVRDLARAARTEEPPGSAWTFAWEGRWPARPDEVFRLYRRER
jgi:4-amino-4-deoxy-L-arabinose transferase-like glycosyltransferase